MRVTSYCCLLIFTMSYFVTFLSNAQEQEELKPILVINETLVAMAELLKDGQLVDQEVLERVDNKIIDKNIAEQYIVGVLEGAVYFQQENFSAAITRLEKLDDIEEELAEEQASSAIFRQVHALLSDSYIAVEDYDKGFVEKKSYLLKLFKDIETIDRKRIEALTSKYQLEQKNKAKVLLEEKSRLKKLEIVDAQRQESENERDMIILICVSVLFIILLLRQLSIRRRLLQLATIDSLTSLHNRSSLFGYGRDFFEQAKSGQQGLSIIFLDIDYFKKVNDTLGHFVGDKLLIHLAGLSKEAMRSRDVLCRFSGEEFVALLPDASHEEAKAIAQRLKDKIQQNPLHINGLEVKVSASIGVAEYNDHLTNFDELLKLADRAMKLAKLKGRDQVVTAKSSELIS